MNIKLIKLAAICSLVAAGTAAMAQDIQERTIKIGHLNNTDHPTSMGVKKFAEIVTAKSGGKIKVTEFASSQLGNEMQQQSALMGGVQEMLVASTTSLTGIVKEFGLLDFPFLFSHPRQADAMVDGPLGQMLKTRLNDKGIVVLGFFDLGFRNVTNSKRPITKGEDLDGLKLRVIPNPVFVETFKAFKANPLPLPFAELYGALESKTVDGQENPYAVILSNKFYEVNKYVSETNHVYATNPIQVSKKFWDKLSPVEQKLLQDAASEAQNYQRVVSRDVSSKAVNELKAKGMVFNQIAEAEQLRMRAEVKAVHDKFAASYDPAVVKLFKSELERVSKL
ncbi:TRAP transporter substrate-binding protein [Curvibacter sp. RS43]|uniref:TRAP transporter substrate-binding protein n=1 Tax=Curvibacter microcysteis TaxID=3026419 RepID=A0ABT5MI90_9BURK|nr:MULTISPECIES: TRAP transporter substrate-binding protein [unclassified Curvibacter]MDD0809668.1 TRAP transporter substrate-binding protein [Curvibacter sp. RS43]MDD0814846.1 TRAP transporter substrate-binding protein [Curvibacter sp. HBC28]